MDSMAGLRLLQTGVVQRVGYSALRVPRTLESLTEVAVLTDNKRPIGTRTPWR